MKIGFSLNICFQVFNIVSIVMRRFDFVKCRLFLKIKAPSIFMKGAWVLKGTNYIAFCG